MTEVTQQKDPTPQVPAAPVGPNAASAQIVGDNKTKLRRKKRRIKIIVASIIAVILAVATIILLRLFVFTPEVKGEILDATVGLSTIQSKVEGMGTAMAKDSATLAPDGGKVMELFVAEGDTVTIGQPLYRLDDTEAQAAVTKARENVLDYQKQLQAITDSYKDLTLVAPHAGKLMDIAELKVGEEVTKGQKIATVADDTKMKLSLYFSYSYETDIAVGQTATISLPANMSTLTGTVEAVNFVRYVAPEGSVLFEVVLVMDNPGTLGKDMDATAILTSSAGTAIYPYSSGKLAYYRTSNLVAKGAGPIEQVGLQNYAGVTEGQLLLKLGKANNDKEVSDKQELLKTAQKTLDEAVKKLEGYHAVSPIDGKVITCTLVEGNAVASGASINIADTSIMTVQLQVDERNIGFVTPGMLVDLKDQAGNFYTGTLESVSLTAKGENGVAAFPAIVKVENSTGLLMAGMYMDYSFIASQSDNCLVVPIQAVKYVTFDGIDLSGVVMPSAAPLPTGAIPMDGEMAPADGEALPEGSAAPEASNPPDEEAVIAVDDIGGGGTVGGGSFTPSQGGGGMIMAEPMPVGGTKAQGKQIAATGKGYSTSNLSSTTKKDYSVENLMSIAVMGGGGGNSGAFDDKNAAAGGANTGTIVYVKGDKAPSNAIPADPAWEVPEGYFPVIVTIGLADTMNVEILTGLNEGDVVFVNYITEQVNSWG